MDMARKVKNVENEREILTWNMARNTQKRGK
jgi:hypothetical protein